MSFKQLEKPLLNMWRRVSSVLKCHHPYRVHKRVCNLHRRNFCVDRMYVPAVLALMEYVKPEVYGDNSMVDLMAELTGLELQRVQKAVAAYGKDFALTKSDLQLIIDFQLERRSKEPLKIEAPEIQSFSSLDINEKGRRRRMGCNDTDNQNQLLEFKLDVISVDSEPLELMFKQTEAATSLEYFDLIQRLQNQMIQARNLIETIATSEYVDQFSAYGVLYSFCMTVAECETALVCEIRHQVRRVLIELLQSVDKVIGMLSLSRISRISPKISRAVLATLNPNEAQQNFGSPIVDHFNNNYYIHNEDTVVFTSNAENKRYGYLRNNGDLKSSVMEEQSSTLETSLSEFACYLQNLETNATSPRLEGKMSFKPHMNQPVPLQSANQVNNLNCYDYNILWTQFCGYSNQEVQQIYGIDNRTRHERYLEDIEKIESVLTSTKLKLDINLKELSRLEKELGKGMDPVQYGKANRAMTALEQSLASSLQYNEQLLKLEIELAEYVGHPTSCNNSSLIIPQTLIDEVYETISRVKSGVLHDTT